MIEEVHFSPAPNMSSNQTYKSGQLLYIHEQYHFIVYRPHSAQTDFYEFILLMSKSPTITSKKVKNQKNETKGK